MDAIKIDWHSNKNELFVNDFVGPESEKVRIEDEDDEAETVEEDD